MMMKITRHASAAWQGGLKDGKGSISTESGALKAYPSVSPAGSKARKEAIPRN
jgi:hypothetical protein